METGPARTGNTSMRHRWLVLIGLLLGSCAAPPPAPPVPEGAPADYPEERYASPGADTRVYAVDSSASLAAAYAYRGGALARMGHDHVVAARDIEGFVRTRPGDDGTLEVSGDLYAALGKLSVDEAELRELAGFTTEPSPEDVGDTRANMLESLDAASFPFVDVSVRGTLPAAVAGETEIVADVRVRLHGVTRHYEVPVTVRMDRERLAAAGEFPIKQSDFGIEPFSILGGTLRVRDTVDVRFDVAARRREAGPDGD